MLAMQITSKDELNPSDYVLIKKDDLELLQQHIVELAEQADLTGQWWTLKEVTERYHISREWLLNNILFVPKFEKILHYKAVMYDGDGGGRGYMFEPQGFSDFMKKWFPDIAKQKKYRRDKHD
ncbi:DUF771 domain-containing protein [Lacticaseibacillus saniviri]|nr:DUF771 domain-containing protein [Lacticaseibacillus saniviri]